MPRHRTQHCLLVLPGWKDGSRHLYDTLEQSLTPKGWAVRRANLPDDSWPESRLATEDREHSLRQAIDDYDRMKGSDTSQVAVLGFSYGGYMAALLTALRPVDLLVLRAPALYPDDGWHTPKEALDKRHIAHFRQQKLGPGNNRALRCCADYRGDVLLIEGEEDEIIPSTVVSNYGHAFPFARSLTRHTLERSDHQLSNAEAQSAYCGIVTSWLQAHAND